MDLIISGLRFLLAAKFFLIVFFQLFFIQIMSSSKAPGFGVELVVLSIFLILLLFVEGVCSFQHLKQDQERFKLPRQEVILFAVLVILSFIYFLYNSQIINIWHDEMSQFSAAFRSPLYMASVRHQPSLSLYQTALSTFLFDDVRLQVRFFTFLNCSIFSYLLFSFVRKITGTYWSALLSLILCYTCFGFLYHTVDARPTSLGFVYLLLIFHHVHFKLKQGCWKSYLSLGSLATLFIHTVGFQPIIFLIVYLLIVSIKFIPTQSVKQKLILLLFTIITPLLLFYPFQKYIMHNSAPRIKHMNLFDIIKENISQFHWLDFQSLHNININGYLYFFTLALVALFLFLKRKSSQRHVFNVAIIFLMISFLYALIAHNAYMINIDHWFRHRYVSFFYITLSIGLSTLVYTMYSWIPMTSIKNFFLSAFLTILVFSPLKYTSYKYLKNSKNEYFFDGIRQFEVLKKIANKNKPEVICLEATNNYLLRHCFGIKHLNQHYDQMNQFYKKDLFATYPMSPNYKGEWFNNYERIKKEGFVFIFIHDLPTIKKLKSQLVKYESIIKESALYVHVPASSENEDKFKDIMKEVSILLENHKKLKAKENIAQFISSLISDK